jgi:hypothetical protein
MVADSVSLQWRQLSGPPATRLGFRGAARCSATLGDDSIARERCVATSSAVNRDGALQPVYAQDGDAPVDVQRR